MLLLALGFGALEYLIGGTRLLFSLPGDGVFALAALVSVLEIRRSKVRPDGLCLLSSVAFFGYVLGRALSSPVVYLAWSDQYLVLGALIVYLLTACYFTDPRRRLWLLFIFLVLAGVNLAVAARQFSGGDDYMLNGFSRASNYRGRGSGLYICPDHLAGFLEMVGSLTLAMAIWSRQAIWLKLLLGYCALCCFAGLVLTLSRGGALSATAALLTIAACGVWRARAASPRAFVTSLILVAVLGGLAAAALGTVLSNSSVVRKRAATLLDQQDVRLLLWPAALKEFAVNPIIGTGAGTYRFYGRLFRDPRVQRDPIRAHNDYLELLAEYGLVGAAGLLFFLFAHLQKGWRTFHRLGPRLDAIPLATLSGSNAAAWNIGALAAVNALLVHSCFDFNLHIPVNACLLAFIFAILANPGRRLTQGEDLVPERFARRDLWPRLALPALALWIFGFGLPKLPGEYYTEQARVALRDKHNLLALHFAQLGLEQETQNPDLYFYLGEARQNLAGIGPPSSFQRSFREAAIEPYRAGLRLAPQDSAMLLRLGEALTRLGDFAAAEPVFTYVLHWDPNSSLVYTYYGFFLQSAGRAVEARAAYRHALSLGYVAAAGENLNHLSTEPQAVHAAE